MSVDDVKMKVQRMLADLFGSVRVDADGSFILQNGSAVAFVDVIGWGDDSSLIKIYSWLLTEVPITSDLYQWTATEGQNFYFGAAKVVPNPSNPAVGGIMFQHVLLGDFLDKDELMAAVVGVAGTGDDLDDELQARFGGFRFTDPME